jgi:tetratricopeptide (TPR) repeat protein
MKKTNGYLMILSFLAFPVLGFADDLEALKADFLQGNYRRVIFEGQAQLATINVGNTDELNYLLGLCYLKEGRLALAQDCFSKILNNRESKFRVEANLGLADTYLIGGRFQEAEEIYNKLINEQPNIAQKAAVLYRLSQLEYKRNNKCKADEYLSEIKRNFPLSPELRFSKGIEIINQPTEVGVPVKQLGEYSIQVGFFLSVSNATKLRDKLLAEDFPAYIENSAGGYRVKVGKLMTEKEMLDLEAKLTQKGFPTKICQ